MSRHIVARRRHIHLWSDGRGSEEQAARRSVKRLCRATDTAADNDDVASAPDWTFAPPPTSAPVVTVRIRDRVNVEGHGWGY